MEQLFLAHKGWRNDPFIFRFAGNQASLETFLQHKVPKETEVPFSTPLHAFNAVICNKGKGEYGISLLCFFWKDQTLAIRV